MEKRTRRALLALLLVGLVLVLGNVVAQADSASQGVDPYFNTHLGPVPEKQVGRAPGHEGTEGDLVDWSGIGWEPWLNGLNATPWMALLAALVGLGYVFASRTAFVSVTRKGIAWLVNPVSPKGIGSQSPNPHPGEQVSMSGRPHPAWLGIGVRALSEMIQASGDWLTGTWRRIKQPLREFGAGFATEWAAVNSVGLTDGFIESRQDLQLKESYWYWLGRTSADIFGLGQGVYEVIAGASMATGGVVVGAGGTFVTGGLAAPAAVPAGGAISVAGIAVATHGLVGLGTAAARLRGSAQHLAYAKSVSQSTGNGVGETVRGRSKVGVFEPASYHGSRNSGRKNKGPSNGQSSLDNSFQIKKTSPRRVGVDPKTGQIVVFDETHPGKGIFHGHVRTWGELTDEMRRTLIDRGLFNVKGRYLGGN